MMTVCKKVTVCQEVLCQYGGEGAPGDHTGQEDVPEECAPAGKLVGPGSRGRTNKANNQTNRCSKGRSSLLGKPVW